MVTPRGSCAFWCAAVVCFLLVSPKPAAAQTQSHWGAAVSFGPEWNMPNKGMYTVFFNQPTRFDFRGMDFRIGVARGRDEGGDWSVQYLQKRINTRSFLEYAEGSACVTPTSCIDYARRYDLRSTSLRGIVGDKWVPFYTRKRVQVGLKVGGGIAEVRGQVHDSSVTADYVNNSFVLRQEDRDVPASSILAFGESFKYLPVFDLQGGVGVLLAPGLKVKVSAGMNYPAHPAVTIDARYLIGAR